MSTLEVPGARLYYGTRGGGPFLLMIPGAAGHGDSFAIIFGTSSGGIVALDVLTRYPDSGGRSRTHSPFLLPENSSAWCPLGDSQDAYDRSGNSTDISSELVWDRNILPAAQPAPFGPRPAAGATQRQGSMIAAVRISGYPSSMAKILVSIDDKLLGRIDRAAQASGLSRSAYLSRIAAREVGAERGPGADQRARRAVAVLDRLFQQQSHPEDATAAIRTERDAR